MVSKIWIILWKDLLMRKNHYIVTSFEVLIPVVLILIANLSLPKIEPELDKDTITFDKYVDNKCLVKHSLYGSVLYEPATPFTNLLMSKAGCYAGYMKSNVKPGNLDGNNSYYSVGVKFENVNMDKNYLPENLKYTLYPTNKVWINLLKLWRCTGSMIPRYSVPSLHNVIELQRAIDSSFMEMKNISSAKLVIDTTNIYEKGPRIFSVAIHVSLFLAFSLMVPPIVSRIVQEKSTGAKELMIMMGVKKWHLWVAKFIDVIFFVNLAVGGIILFLYIPLKHDSNVLTIPPLIFWGVIMYGLIGAILFLFFVSCFFEKATLAVYVSLIVWTFSFVLNNLFSCCVAIPCFVKYILCLFPSVCVMNGISILLDFDFYGKTVRVTEKLSGTEHYLNLMSILLMMTLNIFLYATLTWYLEHVKPGKFGVPLPYNFFITKSYWNPRKVESAAYNKNTNTSKESENFEPVPNNLEIGVSLQKVSKVYKSLKKGLITAVDNVSLNFYKTEISGLLGHNGAGKTTVFSIITGLTYPTSGKVYINGYDMAINVSQARRSLGLCPQQDMLFNSLTTQQTLKFYGMIKGMSLRKAKAEALELIKKLKLEKVKNTQAKKLSGGQKRKLSLAIALIGGSEVLVLDEPTSGMDPEIRREIWEILLGFRGTKTILLTTHFMEEADALCDRIAIMDHGKVKCFGSPMFLKSKFGKGYVLSVVVVNQAKAAAITNYIQYFIPSTKLKSQNLRTLTYEIPESEVELFPALLSGLDEKQSSNEIASYGISLATLEDVFLRLRSGALASDGFDAVDAALHRKADKSKNLKPISCALYVNQFWALLIKKWIIFERSYKSFLLYSILPATIVILITVLSQKKASSSNSYDLSGSQFMTFSTGLYAPFTVFYSDSNGNISSAFEKYFRSLNCKVEKVGDIAKAVNNVFNEDFYRYSTDINLAFGFSPALINILYNEEAVHIIPVGLNAIHNLQIKASNVSASIQTSVNISLAKQDFFVPVRKAPKCNVEEMPDFSGTQTVYYMFGPTKENVFGAKEIQLMMTPAALYWFSSLVFDLISFSLYIIVVAFGVGVSANDEFMLENGGEIIVGLLLWGAGLILLAYVTTTIVKNVAAAYSVFAIVYILLSFIVFNLIRFGSLPSGFQYLHPSCILKFGFIDLCAGKPSNYILILLVYDVMLFFLLCIKDSGFFNQIIHKMCNKCLKVRYAVDGEEDIFVKKEVEEVKKLISKDTSGAVLIVDDLKKWYTKRCKPMPAVRGISFTVHRGECFGLLGVNGAGKTSTFRMLTGALPATHGTTYVCSSKLTYCNRQKYLFSIGYCPQSGGLIPIFKGRELLQFFARLRGLNNIHVNEEVRRWLHKFDLLEFSNQECGTYSGGNQRKLSMAISLIGDCPLIFLDEPTSGVDPLSRRSMWNVVGKLQKEGQSVVLTSHSMDECEALCSRLAIMVNGRFRCIGETTTLKDRFGQGYWVHFKLTSSAVSEAALKEFKTAVAERFDPGCELIDEHLTVLEYHVKNKSITWAELFAKLKTLKEDYDIVESYTASATTLEQIFIHFARNQ